MEQSLRPLAVALGVGSGIGIAVALLRVLNMPSVLPGPAPGVVASSAWINRSQSEIRRAAAAWQRRPGPAREVVDVVCLVPDLPTFLEAIATWDEAHAFPILIDDAELALKFVRAFRPSRIVRYPRRAPPIPADRLWDAAVEAIGASRRAGEREPDGTAPAPPDAIPRRLGPTPPGVVLSSPDSAALAGAVALAAGRFQPLIRWEVAKRFADVLTRHEARMLARDLESRVADRVKEYGGLGDDCDFLTLAGDWPYRYQDRDGPAAFDDLVGRGSRGDAEPRWAFAGRLLGDATASVYRAMCSLFLQPESALLLNTYGTPGQPWSDYAMGRAADRLSRRAEVSVREGGRADLSEWSRLLGPINRFGLVLINTQGDPSVFQLPGGPGQTGDIPPSVPAAVSMIHSFSATDPTDPGTIAGRWLANGAFVYFGSLHEPYLQSFRPPAVLAGLVAEGVPLGAACRRNPPDPFSQPWRLVYLGDPLYRLRGRDGDRERERLERWDSVADWPAYIESRPPDALAPEDARLEWALRNALLRLRRDVGPGPAVDLPTYLLAIRRDRLDARLRPAYDALLIDTLLESGPPGVLLDRLAHIPPAGRSAVAGRALESLQAESLQALVAARDFPRALDFWSEVLATGPAAPFFRVITDRVAALADAPERRHDWHARLLSARGRLGSPSPLLSVVAGAIAHVEKKSADPP